MEDSVRIYVPVSITYAALEGALKSQLVGEYLPKPEPGSDSSPYAQVLDVGIRGSSTGPNEVILRVKVRILRTVMKRDQVDLYVLANLQYDNTSQQLYAQQFHLTSRTNSGFYNTALEVMANKVAYSQILSKARINLGAIISGELLKANQMLEEGQEVKGIRLMGAVHKVSIQDMTLLPDKVTLAVELRGNVEAHVLDLSELLPSKMPQ